MHLHKNKEYVHKNQINRVGIIEINIKLKLAINYINPVGSPLKFLFMFIVLITIYAGRRHINI